MSRWVGSRTWRLLGLWLLLMALSGGGAAVAQTPAAAPFDHLSTGYALTDAHARASCESCHQGGVLKGTPRSCDGCHVAGRRLSAGNTVMPPTHLPTLQTCDSCHNSASFIGARFKHIGVTPGSCAGCHNGVVTDGKTANHVPTTAACDSCHRSTAWLPARGFDHAGVVPGSCQGCHNGSRATGKPAQHMPTGTALGCDSCHASTRAWVPTTWNHTQTVVTAQCASCHNGGYPPADGKPANHIPYTAVPITAAANCDGCHKGSTTTWTNGRLHANYALSTSCATCHNGSYGGAVGKPSDALHATVTGNCESCHKSTTSWSVVDFAHSPANAVGTGTCDTCHNGSTAGGKPPTHIPVPAGAAKCDSCHRSQASWTASVTMNHGAVVAGSCKSCHGGGYTGAGATAKPANHIPEVQLLGGATMDCNACHTATTGWGSLRMNHNNSQGNGAGWCKACHDRSTNWLGDMEKKALTHEKSSGVTDCSQSGCHRPLGKEGSPYTKWE
jgi:hypothetical protein